jgi:large subunit ribosomal protein L32e
MNAIEKKKKPVFKRSDSHKKVKLGTRWKKPRGLQNKKRLCKKGYGANVSTGYMNSKDSKGKTVKGLLPVKVSNISNFIGLDKKTCGIIIGSVGAKKKLVLLDEAKKQGFQVLNLKVEETIKKINSSLEERKKSKKQKEEEKKTKEKSQKEEKKDIESKVQTEEKTLSDDEKKEEEKKKKDKALIAKQ